MLSTMEKPLPLYPIRTTASFTHIFLWLSFYICSLFNYAMHYRDDDARRRSLSLLWSIYLIIVYIIQAIYHSYFMFGHVACIIFHLGFIHTCIYKGRQFCYNIYRNIVCCLLYHHRRVLVHKDKRDKQGADEKHVLRTFFSIFRGRKKRF